MKSFIFALVTVLALPHLALAANGPQQCSRCIQSCNDRAKDDAEAERCLNNCLRQSFCNEAGFGLLLNTAGELSLCSADSKVQDPTCAPDQDSL